MPDNRNILLLTGRPGVGKTTVVCSVAHRLEGHSVRGFYTQEIREYGERRGFRLITFDGPESTIAHVNFPKDSRVGKYGVDVGAIDRAVETMLTLAPQRRSIYIIDEIGKMECFSRRFVAMVRSLLDGENTVVATIAQSGTGFIEEVKQRGITLWEITRSNRDDMPQRILDWING